MMPRCSAERPGPNYLVAELGPKKVEMRFAHRERIFKLDRMRLRGLSGAKHEVLLTATVQNLRSAKLLCRPPPAPVAGFAQS